MSPVEPWYTKLWPMATVEVRWILGSSVYLIAGVIGAVLAVASSSRMVGTGWLVLAVVFLGLGLTLLLTLRQRR